MHARILAVGADTVPPVAECVSARAGQKLRRTGEASDEGAVRVEGPGDGLASSGVPARHVSFTDAVLGAG